MNNTTPKSNIERKIEKLMEEGVFGYTPYEIGSNMRDVTPEQQQQMGRDKLKKTFSPVRILTGVAGAAGLAAGAMGAGNDVLTPLSAGVLGLSLGTGARKYNNLNDASKMSREDIKKHSDEFQKQHGKPLADEVAMWGKDAYLDTDEGLKAYLKQQQQQQQGKK